MAKAKKKAKRAVGRPTKYKPKFCDLTKYLRHCKAKKELPSLTGYAVFLGVAESTVQKWGKEHDEFSVSLGELLTIEKQVLMNKGLTGKYNSTITKLILSSNHGMKERVDQTSDDKPIETPPTLIDTVIQKIKVFQSVDSGIDNKSIGDGYGGDSGS